MAQAMFAAGLGWHMLIGCGRPFRTVPCIFYDNVFVPYLVPNNDTIHLHLI